MVKIDGYVRLQTSQTVGILPEEARERRDDLMSKILCSSGDEGAREEGIHFPRRLV